VVRPRRLYGLGGLVLLTATLPLLAFWQYPLAILTFVLGVYLLRRGEREEPVR
jgi:hypothetical protein